MKKRIREKMPVVIYGQYSYDCELDSIDIYFEYGNSVVFSTGEKTIVSNGIKMVNCEKLEVISKCYVEQYQGPYEAKRYFRGDNLVIQGIITFFTGLPLTVYHSNDSRAGVKPIEYKRQKIHLSMNGIDYTRDLKILLKKLEEEPELIITLLDRWRKAIYLKAESCDADLYYDESTLSFFHILELFGDTVNGELKKKLEDNIEKMLQQHYANFYFNDSQIKQMVDQNKKAVSSLLIGDYLSLSVKVKYFLEKYELLDDNIAFFIDNMIKVRNAIAHGRITYQKVFIWPLPQFFNLAKDSYENIEFLYFFTAVMISKYVGIHCWEDEWMEIKGYLMPPQKIVDAFLEGEIHIEKDSLIDGNQYNISWRTLFNYYVKKPKKEIRKKIELAVADIFLEVLVNRENASDIFNISLIFADSDEEAIKEKAINNIKLIIEKDWHNWSNIRDAYTYLQFYSVDVVWYKNYLYNKEYLK